jgi:predicted lipase
VRIAIFILVFASYCGYSQNNVTIKITEDDTGQPVKKVIIEILKTNYRVQSDTSGKAIIYNVPDGYYTFMASWVGYNIYTENLDIISTKENYFEFKINKTKHIKVEY